MGSRPGQWVNYQSTVGRINYERRYGPSLALLRWCRNRGTFWVWEVGSSLRFPLFSFLRLLTPWNYFFHSLRSLMHAPAAHSRSRLAERIKQKRKLTWATILLPSSSAGCHEKSQVQRSIADELSNVNRRKTRVSLCSFTSLHRSGILVGRYNLINMVVSSL